MSDEMALLVADVYEAAGALRRQGEHTAQAEGLTQARWQVLSVVSAKALSVPQAARRLGVSRQNVQRVANDLASMGMATFLPNPDHRSSPLLALTPKGHEALQRVTERATAVHAKLFAAFREEEVKEARTLLRKLLTAMDDAEGTRSPR
ncbi:MarR family winged helix-turn-helix transcriptional regulator [Streptomyces sp. NPDC085932]|uniref:MarR family winged helix-turn-helix transcriptional regulator n=1 Tax=Streptomyces sp. NPDC085932 TaxID=3365741 RepID=UPI0037CF15F4